VTTLIERATKSANSVANQTVSTVNDLGAAVAEGVVVTTKDIRAGLKEGRVRPVTLAAAAAIGVVAIVELPVLVAAGGVWLVWTKFRKGQPDAPAEEAEATAEASEAPAEEAETPAEV
jgi:hypothetical protein